MPSIASPFLWVGFTLAVILVLALDLGVFHKKAHEVRVREALTWTSVWVALALAFAAGLWMRAGSARALEFMAGYLIEKSLSIDNVFVFAVVFSAFRIPAADQHRVLFWGILGALLMRAIFIMAGAVLLARFHFMMYVFGALLLLTAIKLLREGGSHSFDPMQSRAVKWLGRVLPIRRGPSGHRFWVREGGRWMATPLMAVLVVIEVSDVVFALDSIPAIFAVTDDPFIVYSSNIFAILGLRSLYFVLASAVRRFRHLRHGMVVILAFVGVKMLIADFYKIPIAVSLAVIVATLAVSVAVSMWDRRHEAPVH